MKICTGISLDVNGGEKWGYLLIFKALQILKVKYVTQLFVKGIILNILLKQIENIRKIQTIIWGKCLIWWCCKNRILIKNWIWPGYSIKLAWSDGRKNCQIMNTKKTTWHKGMMNFFFTLI